MRCCVATHGAEDQVCFAHPKNLLKMVPCIYCTHVDESLGDQNDIGANIKWDARPLSRGGQRYVNIEKDCDDSTLAYSFESNDASRYGGRAFVIVFCPAVFKNYESGRLEKYKNPDLPKDYQVEQWAYGLTATWIHELLHMKALFGDNVCGEYNLPAHYIGQ